MTGVLDIRSASKSFGAVRALSNVGFSVSPGERIALLGHNGAGKTTLFRLILGFIHPDAGEIEVCGGWPGSDAARDAIAYLPESVAFPRNLTGEEILHLYAQLKRAKKDQARDALARVGLADAARRRVGHYSKGMRQRLGLALVLLGAPKLVLLDEPTSGLDPQSRQEFYGCFSALAEEGAAIVFSSHTLNGIDGAADRIVILKSGALVGDGVQEDLRAAADLPVRLRLRVANGNAEEIARRFSGQIVGAGKVEVLCRPEEKVDIVRRVMGADEAVRDIEIHEPSLGDVYRYYSSRGGAA
ncbi:MAG: ABC transporter ATP-binding protein [Parvularculaceae bacterium]